MAVPGGRRRARPGGILDRLRAARPDCGTGVAPGGPGTPMAFQLGLGNPLCLAQLPVPPVPYRAAAISAVAPGGLVRGRMFHPRSDYRAGDRHARLVAPVQYARELP